MSEIEEDDIVHTCNFCGATDYDEKTEQLIMAPDGTLICNACVTRCMAMLLDANQTDFDFLRFSAKQPMATTKKLRSITRIPKSWVICESHLFKSIPSVTACSKDGLKSEEFSIPIQLALWMIYRSEPMDIDKIREKIKGDLKSIVKNAIQLY